MGNVKKRDDGAADDNEMVEDLDEALIRAMERKAETYEFIARLFRVEVDEELLAGLHSMRFPTSTGNDKVDEGHALILKHLGKPADNELLELSKDYVRAFLGSGVDGLSAAYPYESVYTSAKRLLMQEARDEVLAIYRSYGLDKNEGWKDGEDHIALELEFEAALCRRCADALRAGDEETAHGLELTQRNFLHDHLLNWVPMMTADVRRFAQTDLYRGLALLTEGFLETDAEFLDELLADEGELADTEAGDGQETLSEQA